MISNLIDYCSSLYVDDKLLGRFRLKTILLFLLIKHRHKSVYVKINGDTYKVKLLT